MATITIKATDIVEILGEDLGEEILAQLNDGDLLNADGSFVCTGEIASGLIEENCDDEEGDVKKALKKLAKYEDALVVFNADNLPAN